MSGRQERSVEERIEQISRWIAQQVEDAGAEGGVVGLSGGIDSSVTAALTQKACPDSTLGIIMPVESNPQDEEDARLLGQHLSLPLETVELAPAYRAVVKAVTDHDSRSQTSETDDVALANIKPRLRMTVLYYFANRLNRLVIGTGNLSELAVGYFTKYGDGGVDIEPLGTSTKTEVRAMARALNLPGRLIEKPPSAGLWEGQTDEGELGLTYETLDTYLEGEDIPEDDKQQIEAMETASAHKRQMPPAPPF